jgi:hypothetical protein
MKRIKLINCLTDDILLGFDATHTGRYTKTLQINTLSPFSRLKWRFWEVEIYIGPAPLLPLTIKFPRFPSRHFNNVSINLTCVIRYVTSDNIRLYARKQKEAI